MTTVTQIVPIDPQHERAIIQIRQAILELLKTDTYPPRIEGPDLRAFVVACDGFLAARAAYGGLPPAGAANYTLSLTTSGANDATTKLALQNILAGPGLNHGQRAPYMHPVSGASLATWIGKL